jgi:hypothetical protein
VIIRNSPNSKKLASLSAAPNPSSYGGRERRASCSAEGSQSTDQPRARFSPDGTIASCSGECEARVHLPRVTV